MNGTSPAIALFSASVAAVIFYFLVRAVKAGRIFSKGKFVEKKKQPVSYWMSMVAYATAGLALLFYAVVGMFPDIIRHS